MTNSACRSASHTPIILKKEEPVKKACRGGPGGKLAGLHDMYVRARQHHMFAATMGDDWIYGDPHHVAESYRRRCGMENSYKSYEAVKSPTTSTDYSVRILLWFTPCILYGVWILALFMTVRGRAHILGARPPVALSLLVAALAEMASMQPAGYPSRHPPD